MAIKAIVLHAAFAMLFALMRTPMRADDPKMRLLRLHGK